MNKGLQDIDDLFRSALQPNEETPSVAVWASLNANLDKQDAESHKKRFIGWKKVAILTLFLLSGFILHETGIVKESKGRSKENPVVKIDEQVMAPQQLEINLYNRIYGNPNNGKSDLGGQKKLKMTTVASIAITKKKNHFELNEDLKIAKAHFVPLLEKPIPGSITVPAIAAISSVHTAAMIDSILKNNISKNTRLKKPGQSKRDWAITGFASYEQVNYRLDSDLPTAINNIKHREVHEPSFTGGILATRHLKNHWHLQTGLIYSNTVIGISPQKMYAFQERSGSVAYKFITSSGYTYVKPGIVSPPVPGDSLTTAEAKHTLQYVTIPVMIEYRIDKNRFSFIPGAGIEANFMTSAKVEIDIEDGSNREIVLIHKLNGSKSFYWSFVADAELHFKANKKLSINVRPAFRLAITPITKDNIVETFPYSFGLALGLTYKF